MNQELFNGHALSFLAVVISMVATFQSFRRNPPVDATFATKGEMGAMEGKLSAQAASMRSEFQADIRELFKRIEVVTHELNAADERRTSTLQHEIKELAVHVAKISPR